MLGDGRVMTAGDEANSDRPPARARPRGRRRNDETDDGHDADDVGEARPRPRQRCRRGHPVEQMHPQPTLRDHERDAAAVPGRSGRARRSRHRRRRRAAGSDVEPSEQQGGGTETNRHDGRCLTARGRHGSGTETNQLVEGDAATTTTASSIVAVRVPGATATAAPRTSRLRRWGRADSARPPTAARCRRQTQARR